jgi:hypothetical protein
MQTFTRVIAAAALALPVLSCEHATAPGVVLTPSPTPPTPRPVALIITPDPLVFAQGDTVHLGAVVSTSDGRQSRAQARWASSDSQIVAIRSGAAIGVAPGKATISASIDSIGLRAEASAFILEKAAPTPGALIVLRFFMTEFEYPSAPGHWFYAPQVQVVAAAGRVVYVSSLTFSIPGLDDPVPPWGCGARITADKPVELNGEVYGDWAVTFDETGHQASGADATAKITYYEDAVAATTITLRGPIVRGSLPTTYGGDSGACYHG